MFLLNLSAAEFLSLLGLVGGLVTALYLLDRSKRKRAVATLQFWREAGTTEDRQAKRRVRDPWSLLLQLLGLALLLLAVSQVQFGGRDSLGRDHVVLIDNSSWSGARPLENNGSETVLHREKAAAIDYIRALPNSDRVMLVAAAGIAVPVTSFTKDRLQLTAALQNITAGYSMLNVGSVLTFARESLAWGTGKQGEIVYVGPQLSADTVEAPVAGLRILPIAADRENCGITQLSVKQGADGKASWQAFITAKNYGASPRRVHLKVQYGRTLFALRQLFLPAGGERTAEYVFSTETSGELAAHIDGGDSLPTDDGVSVRVSVSSPLRVAIYSDRAALLKPLLEAGQQLVPAFYTPSQYQPHPPADLIVLDRIAPAEAPKIPALWIDPPNEHSPLPVKTSSVKDSVLTWNADAGSDASLRGKPVHLPIAKTFQVFEGDTILASVPEGPVVVTRRRSDTLPPGAIVGFDPFAGELRFEVVTPLLFADLLEALSPAAFRSFTEIAEPVGMGAVKLDPAEQKGAIRVLDHRGVPIPFTVRGKSLEFFSARPTSARVLSDEREQLVELRLPAVADRVWKAPAGTAYGVPQANYFGPAARNLWKWFAVAGASVLLLEWWLYGGLRAVRRRFDRKASDTSKAIERDRELAAK